MKERFKKTLTRERAHADLEAQRKKRYKTQKTDNIGCFVCLGLFTALMLALTVGMFITGDVSVIIFLTFCFCVFLLFSARKTPKPEPLGLEDFRILRDTVVKKRKESDEDSVTYFLVFEELGEVCVNLYTVDWGYLNNRPGYKDTEVGERFVVAVHTPVRESSERAMVFYSAESWKVRDLTSEEIAEEISQEDDLIARLIACERFPKLQMRKDHFKESRELYWVPENKTREQQNLVEHFAVRYCSRDVLGALEFILRYCPPELQEEAQRDYTPQQHRLADILREHKKTDDARKKRQEAKNKIKKMLHRSDPEG